MEPCWCKKVAISRNFVFDPFGANVPKLRAFSGAVFPWCSPASESGRLSLFLLEERVGMRLRWALRLQTRFHEHRREFREYRSRRRGMNVPKAYHFDTLCA
jgi:hypothetical protein